MDTTAGLEPSRTTLDAGQDGRVALSVRNDSEIVEDYTFQVVGDLVEWSSVEPPHVSVYPGQTSTTVVTLRPPRTSAVSAGEHPYGVHVRPAKRPENAAVPEGVVELLPFYDTVAELSPQSTKGKRGGTHRVVVDNRGNAPVAVALAAKSASDGLGLTLSESSLTMEPGTTWTSEVRAEPVKRLWRGAPVGYPFTVMVTPDEGPATALAGTQQQTPVLPAWTLRSLMGALALAVGAVVLFFSPVGDRACRALARPDPPGICPAVQTEPKEPGPEVPGPEEPGPEEPGPGDPEPGGPGPEEPGPEEPGPEEPGPEVPGPEEPGPEEPGQEEPAPEEPGPEEPGPEAPAPEEPDPLDPQPSVPVLPETISFTVLPGAGSHVVGPWPREVASGPFTVTGLTVVPTAGDVGTFDLVVVDGQGELTLWLQQPLADVVPGESLVREDAAEEQGTGEAMADRLREDPTLRDAVDQLQLDVPGLDTAEPGGGGTEQGVGPTPTPAPVRPFTVQPDEKVLLAVRCETGNQPTGQCFERVTVHGAHEQTEGGG